MTRKTKIKDGRGLVIGETRSGAFRLAGVADGGGAAVGRALETGRIAGGTRVAAVRETGRKGIAIEAGQGARGGTREQQRNNK